MSSLEATTRLDTLRRLLPTSRAAPEPAPISSGRRWVALAALLGATFVGTINNSVANVAVPALASSLRVDISTAVWVVSAFALSLGTLMPLAGRVGDMYGPRRVFLVGTVLFSLASVVVATGDHIGVVVLGRVLQGVAGAPVLPCILATIARLFPQGQRARAVAMWAAINAAALAAGPAVGGLIVDGLGWRAIFWMSSPAILLVGGFVLVLVPRDLPSTPRRLDMVGAGLVALMLGTLVVPITEASRWGWVDARTVGLLVVSGASLAVLVRHLGRVDEPFVQPALLRLPGLMAVTGVASMQMVALFAVTFAVPVFLVVGAGVPAGTAGLVTSVLPVFMLVGALFSGRLSTRVALPDLIFVGGCLMVVGCVVTGSVAPSKVGMALGLVAVGVGVSLIQAPAAAAVTLLAPPDQTGIAAGLFNTARFVLGGLGATVAAVVFDAASGRAEGEQLALGAAQVGLRWALGVAVAASAVTIVVSRRVKLEHAVEAERSSA